ncbi:sucrase-isomaltase, intestinal-like [Littorina saxatilis]|uniref:sucrase-isomaltase, intestinal-like n=1 Tax=Littorina saxatilis TaxID=31220 RepID=UPI0038B5C96C
MADTPPETPKRRSGKKRLIFVVILILVTAAALAVGISLNLTLKDDEDDTASVPVKTARFLVNCHPDNDASKSRCEERGCIWVERTDADKKPKCSFPEAYGYKMAGDPEEHAHGVKVMLTRIDTPPLYGMTPYINLTVAVEFHTDKRLRIKIMPTDVHRFEIPEEAINITSPSQPPSNETRLYDVTFQTDPVFGLSVTRRSTNATIFNTSLPGLAFYPQLLQVSVLLQNSYVYGFGEHKHMSFRHDMNYRRWSIFTRDEAPVHDWNLYGAQPVYMNVEDEGKANLVFLKNSNALEVFLQPDPSITFRSIGGVLDFYVFLGDSPGEAVSLYTKTVSGLETLAECCFFF